MSPTGILEVLGKGGVVGIMALLASALVAVTLMLIRSLTTKTAEILAVYERADRRVDQLVALGEKMTQHNEMLGVLALDAKRRLERAPRASSASSEGKTVVIRAPVLVPSGPKP